MKLNIQKRIIADKFNVSPKRVTFDDSRKDEIKEAITKADLKSLVKDKAIKISHARGISKARARVIRVQKRKGRRQGQGSRKGKSTARLPAKEEWMNKIRALKAMLKTLRDKEMIETSQYRNLYMKAKGGFFRSRRHMRLYIEEQNIIKKKE